MRQIYNYNIDCSIALLSTFDLGGSLAFSSLEDRITGIDHDMQQLENDLKILEKDYLKAIDNLYCDRSDCVNFDSARQSQIEAQQSERGRPFPVGKADEEDRFGKVAASQNSHNLSGRSIT